LILFSQSPYVVVQDGWHFTALFESDTFCAASQLTPSCRGRACLRSAARQMTPPASNVARNVCNPAAFAHP
ncbi:hypothetical protein K443DRAFT_418210, partial [Laccaria amethystina LaAM-08-1]